MAISDKLTYLAETKSQLKNTINYSGASITDDTFRQYPRKLYTQYLDILKKPNTLFNGMPKVPEQTGTKLTINDTANTRMKLELNPSELTQETTTGANIQKFTKRSSSYADMEYNCDENGQVTVTGTSTGTITWSYNVLSTDAMTLEPGTYIVKVIGTYSNRTKFRRNDNGTFSNLDLDSNNEATITIDSTTSNFGLAALYDTGVHNDNFYLTLAKNTATTERYTGGIPQPNPEFPSEVQVIKGNNSIKIENKNLIDLSKATDGKYIKSSDGSLSTYADSLATDYIEVQENKQYYFSGMTTLNSGNTGAMYDKDKNYVGGISRDIDIQPLLIPNNVKYVRLSIWKNNYANPNSPTPQLEQNNEATTYVPHQEQVLPLNLPVENLFDKSTVSNNKYVKSSDGDLANLNGYIASDYIEITPNTQYYWNDSADRTNAGAFYNSSKIYISGISNRLFTTPSNAKYVRLTSESSLLDTLQLEKGDKANQYTPYGTTPIEYCKIGTYEDEFEHSGDKWYLNKYIGKYTMLGTETFYNTSTRTNTFRFTYEIADKLPNNSNLSMFKCNRGNGVPDAYWSTDVVGICEVQNSTRAWIIFSLPINEVYNTLTAQTWFDNNETIIYYVLATPTHTEITDTTLISQLNAIEQAVSYDEQTNISQVNTGLPFRIKASAVKNLESVFE